MKTLAIFNTPHYRLKKKTVSNEIINQITTSFYADVVMTDYPKHATEIAKISKNDNYELLIAIGGDGTISEIVNGMDLANQKLGIIPFGTGNGFARHLGLKNVEHAMKIIGNSVIKKVDVVKILFKMNNNEFNKRFVATASFGFVSEVIDLANKRFKKMGSMAYIVASIFVIIKQNKFKMSLEFKENIKNEIIANAFLIGNNKYFGNFCVFPNANLSDGKFDVLAGETTVLSQIFHYISVLTKTHFYKASPEYQIDNLRVIVDPPQKLMTDGEIFENVSMINCEMETDKLNCFA